MLLNILFAIIMLIFALLSYAALSDLYEIFIKDLIHPNKNKKA